VRYDEFRDRLEAALQRNGLYFHSLQRVETIELANTLRQWKVYVYGAAPPSPEPFHVSAEISFAWSPFDAARAYAREEDLLTELTGRRKQLPRTVRRWRLSRPLAPRWAPLRFDHGNARASAIRSLDCIDSGEGRCSLCRCRGEGGTHCGCPWRA
jgi:hypothetical protein